MCGIVGYFLGRQVSTELTQRMADCITHRGPDDEGFYHGTSISLGMKRLSIIDRAGGAQPIYNESGNIVVIYNGEIYNHDNLRTKLLENGHHFSTNADTEVLVHGFEQWGMEGLLKRLNGMFAFALYDIDKNKLFFARDRLGIKPLYYTSKNGTLYFGSEIKSFSVIDEISFEPNIQAIPEYLALRYVPTPMTMFKNIFKLPAGHYMVVDSNGNQNISQYWHLEGSSEKMTDEEYVSQFGELFHDAVKIRLKSEVPLGAYLSGGLDSNMVVWSMSQQVSRPVTTYSMGFGSKYDETPDARKSANLFCTEHNEFIFGNSELDLLPKTIWHLDEPLGDGHILPTYVLAREAKKKLTVILLGEGADESLYGYPFYKVAWLARKISHFLPSTISKTVLPNIIGGLPLNAFNAVFPMPTTLGEDGRIQLSRFLRTVPDGDGETILRILAGLFINKDLNDLMLRPPTVPPCLPRGCFSPQKNNGSPDHLLQQIYAAQFSGWLQDFILLRHDKMSMAHSVECRVPFLDHRIVEFLAKVPRRLKVSGWKDKIISRRFAGDFLPKQLAKKAKTPFFIPMERFLSSTSFQQMVKENLSRKRVQKRGYFKYEKVEELLSRASNENFLAVKRITSLIILEIWHRIFIDKEIRF